MAESSGWSFFCAKSPTLLRDVADRLKHSINCDVEIAKNAEAEAKVAGGWEAFAARVRQLHIDGFEAKVAKRGFDPYIATWAVRLDLAQKAAASKQYVGPRYFGQTDLVAIVSAVIQAKKE